MDFDHNGPGSPAEPRGSVLLGHDLESGEKVSLPSGHRPRGVAIVGKSGTGKSSLLEHLILADLAGHTPAVVIDPHGSLADRVMALAPTEDLSRIILLEPAVSQPLGLNLLDVREPLDEDDSPVTWAANSALAAFKKLYKSDDQYQAMLEHYLPLAARTLAYNGMTLAQVPKLFGSDAGFRRRCQSHVPERDWVAHEQWSEYDLLTPHERELHTGSLRRRVWRLLEVPAIERVLASVKTTVPFGAVLAGDSIILLRLSSERLPPDECDLFGALFLCALTDRVFARTVSGSVKRLHIYVDEYQRFATPTVGELFTQGRKFGVGLTIAHQGRGQIGDERVKLAELHAGSLILFRLTRPDAEELSGELPIRPQPERVDKEPEEDGTEPILTISQEPVKDLLSQGHQNGQVRAIAQRAFLPVLRELEQVRSDIRAVGQTSATVVKRISWDESVSSKLQDARLKRLQARYDALSALRQEVDRVLVDVMETRISLEDPAFLRHIAHLASQRTGKTDILSGEPPDAVKWLAAHLAGEAGLSGTGQAAFLASCDRPQDVEWFSLHCSQPEQSVSVATAASLGIAGDRTQELEDQAHAEAVEAALGRQRAAWRRANTPLPRFYPWVEELKRKPEPERGRFVGEVVEHWWHRSPLFMSHLRPFMNCRLHSAPRALLHEILPSLDPLFLLGMPKEAVLVVAHVLREAHNLVAVARHGQATLFGNYVNRKRLKYGDSCSSNEYHFPLIVGMPLAVTMWHISELARSFASAELAADKKRQPQEPGIEYLGEVYLKKIVEHGWFGDLGDLQTMGFIAQRFGSTWESFLRFSEGEPEYQVERVKLLAKALLLHKADLAFHYPELASHVLPDEVLDSKRVSEVERAIGGLVGIRERDVRVDLWSSRPVLVDLEYRRESILIPVRLTLEQVSQAQRSVLDRNFTAREREHRARYFQSLQFGQDLYSLCRLLAADPILVASGQVRARVRPRTIVHPAQTYQDASKRID